MFVVRHGQSEANCDWSINVRKPNHRVELTATGKDQARNAGHIIADLTRNGERVMIFQSPYTRARSTAKQIRGVLNEKDPECEITVKEDPRMREQDFGNFQESESMRNILNDRDEYGMFFYRIPCGESPADVYDRCSSFCDTLFRTFERADPDIVILVSHGIWGRVFLMRWFQWPYEEFERLENLPNARPVIMELNDQGKYKLKEPLKKWC